LPTLVQTSATFSQIGIGDFHTCGLATTGSILCWGRNSEGQLGNGTQNPSSTPTAIGSAFAFYGDSHRWRLP
jgi:alpha-tubulin suppressor-like RCC1 family protein